MAPTSDERREVAARLRRASACGEGISCCAVDTALGLRYDEDYFGDVFTCESVRNLADLIDPEEEDTCCDVSDDGDFFTCSRCGCAVRLRSAEADAFENVTYGPTLTMPNGRGEKLSFCPHCGARVTGEGER